MLCKSLCFSGYLTLDVQKTKAVHLLWLGGIPLLFWFFAFDLVNLQGPPEPEEEAGSADLPFVLDFWVLCLSFEMEAMCSAKPGFGSVPGLGSNIKRTWDIWLSSFVSGRDPSSVLWFCCPCTSYAEFSSRIKFSLAWSAFLSWGRNSSEAKEFEYIYIQVRQRSFIDGRSPMKSVTDHPKFLQIVLTNNFRNIAKTKKKFKSWIHFSKKKKKSNQRDRTFISPAFARTPYKSPKPLLSTGLNRCP